MVKRLNINLSKLYATQGNIEDWRQLGILLRCCSHRDHREIPDLGEVGRALLTFQTSHTSHIITHVWELIHDLNLPPTLSEGEKAINALLNGKASGAHAIPAEIHNYGRLLVLSKLTELFNLMWEQGTLPLEFKDATIVHLYKHKENWQSCDNQRQLHSHQCLKSPVPDPPEQVNNTSKAGNSPRESVQLQERKGSHWHGVHCLTTAREMPAAAGQTLYHLCQHHQQREAMLYSSTNPLQHSLHVHFHVQWCIPWWQPSPRLQILNGWQTNLHWLQAKPKSTSVDCVTSFFAHDIHYSMELFAIASENFGLTINIKNQKWCISQLLENPIKSLLHQ